MADDDGGYRAWCWRLLLLVLLLLLREVVIAVVALAAVLVEFDGGEGLLPLRRVAPVRPEAF